MDFLYDTEDKPLVKYTVGSRYGDNDNVYMMCKLNLKPFFYQAMMSENLTIKENRSIIKEEFKNKVEEFFQQILEEIDVDD